MPLFRSVWQRVGGLGGFEVSAITVISIPFCCNAQKCSHFEIISGLLQGKLTKWNFISCLINTQFASAFCQISLYWTCSFNCCCREWAQNANPALVPPVKYTLTHIFASQPRCPLREEQREAQNWGAIVIDEWCEWFLVSVIQCSRSHSYGIGYKPTSP